jgi:hypothetical protein
MREKTLCNNDSGTFVWNETFLTTLFGRMAAKGFVFQLPAKVAHFLVSQMLVGFLMATTRVNVFEE